MLAYIDGEPVGWCGIGPRTEMERLQRSRTIPRIDDLAVWSVICFVVKAGHRRKGVTTALLEGAIAYAASRGAQILESYPIDPDGKRVSGAFLFVGTTSLFERAGFVRIRETDARSG